MRGWVVFEWKGLLLGLVPTLVWTVLTSLFTRWDAQVIAIFGIGIYLATSLLASSALVEGQLQEWLGLEKPS
mgnify:CR=1 FL=1